MKKFYLFSFVFLAGCLSYPEQMPDEPAECYEKRVCWYYNAKSDGKIDCGQQVEACSRERTWKKCLSEDRPKVYNQKGESIMTFQECWNLRE